jgi:hypothetical protein
MKAKPKIYITTPAGEKVLVATFEGTGDAFTCLTALQKSVSTPGYKYTVETFKNK